MDIWFRHRKNLVETSSNEVSLGLPLGIVLGRVRFQPPDDAFQEAFGAGVPHCAIPWSLSLAFFED
jgi:hypothetical protein